MFCKNCGAELKDGAKFCSKCGTPVTSQSQNQGKGIISDSPVTVSGNTKRIPVLAIGLLVIIIIAVVLILRSCTGGGYEKPIKNLIKGIEKVDGKLMLDALFPDEILDQVEEQTGLDKDAVASMYETTFINHFIDNDEGKSKIKIDYTIEDDDDLSDSEIKEIEDNYEDDNVDVDIKAGKEVELNLKIKTDDQEKAENRDVKIEVIKIGGRWYINPLSL